jgi:uncharacterized membrane protein YkvA (DUF1232 family)
MKKFRAFWNAATLFEKLTLIFSLFYVLTPFDFIPEVVFGIFGLVDDATAIGAFIWTLRHIHKRLEEHPNSKTPDTKNNQVPSNLIP